jgi:hypothetical protein
MWNERKLLWVFKMNKTARAIPLGDVFVVAIEHGDHLLALYDCAACVSAAPFVELCFS